MAGRVTTQVVPLVLAIDRFDEDPYPPLARGSWRAVYPYPMQDDLTDEAAEREFRAVVLDNGLLRLTVLPELGGHVLSLRDLVHGREVFFHNVPLKLGLVAMRGAWWAGGIEWNFPHVGHAVTTSDRVSWRTREAQDGSATVFVGAIEHLTRMAWQVALTLRPDDWRLHVSIRLFNRTPFHQRIYFWSNSAVAARDDFRLLLPATRVFSWWYGADRDAHFPMHEGRDLSRYVNLERGGDIFAKDLRADWFGGYYDELDCGVVHHASRFEVPGRKMFSWGHGGHGEMWAELLNARGEPYVELQSGRFVHQGVHRLLAPGGVEAWEETWAPFWGLGGAVHATEDLVLNATREGDALTLRLLALARIGEASVVARRGEQVLTAIKRSLASGEATAVHVPLRGDGPVTVELNGEKVTLLVEGHVVRPALDGIAPHIALSDDDPEAKPTTLSGWLLKARSCEERNNLDDAADAYHKALELDATCVQAMAGLAQCHLRRCEPGPAKGWGHKALALDPQNEDALWLLSVASLLDGSGEPTAYLAALGRSPRYAANAFALQGEMALRRGDTVAALDLFGAACELSPRDARVVALAAFAARRGGAAESARKLLSECEAETPLEPLLWAERWFLAYGSDQSIEAAIAEVFGADPQAYLEVACDYERLGAWDAADAWLSGVAIRRADPARQAMLHYHHALALWRLGRATEALAAARRAAQNSPLFIFPHRHEDGEALRTALRLCPDDPVANLLLGTWHASLRRWDEAVSHWTRSVQLARDGESAILSWRNIALARWHKGRNAPPALAAYARAIELLATAPPASPLHGAAWRLWLERDGVLAGAGQHDERATALDAAPEAVKAHPQIVARRVDAFLRAGRLEQALALLAQCSFKPWEGEHRARVLWKEAHMLAGHRAKEAGHLVKARDHFEAAATYPRHLRVGRPTLTDDADALFWAGWCAAQLGDAPTARRLLSAAATESQPREAATAEFKTRAAELLKTLAV